MVLSFHPGLHEYRAGDRVLPSVTGILRACGLTGSFEFRDRIHAFRGTAVHAGSAMIISGDNEYPSLHPLPASHAHDADYVRVHREIPGYFEACRAAKAAIKFTGTIYECPFIDPVRGYGGTLDFCAWVEGRDQLWDIKSGTFPVMTVVQLCAYEDAARRGLPVNPDHPGLEWLLALVNSGRPIERCGLRLEKTGRFTAFYETPKGESYQLPKWMSAWRSALLLYTAIPDHLYVETAPDGTPVRKSRLSDLNWVAERARSLPSPTYDAAMRAGENIFNLRQQYGLP